MADSAIVCACTKHYEECAREVSGDLSWLALKSCVSLASRFRELVPNARVKFLADDVGHYPQVEAPHAVLKAYFAFLDSDVFSEGTDS